MEQIAKPNPAQLVLALRALVNASKDKFGPDLDEALKIGAKFEIPEKWILAVVLGWRKFAETYDRPFASELAKKSPVRFLRANILPDLKFEDGTRICRLCGEACQPPARLWHPQCWAAFEPATAKGWKRLTKEAIKRAGGKCESCQTSLKELKITNPEPWRRVYDVDHKTPLFKGGSHSLENIQILCRVCHQAKTSQDLSGPRSTN